jgi:solute:Na+ symporter, SSS family
MKKELVLNMRLLIFYYFNGALLGVFLLALFTRRTNGTGAFSGLIAGMVSVWFVTQFFTISFLYNNIVGTVVAFGVGYLVSLLGAKPADNKLKGMTMYEKDADVQEKLAERAAVAAAVEEGIIEEKRTNKWPIYLIAYFVLVLIFLFVIQGM